MTTSPLPQREAWLRGPIPGVPTPLQPVAHALVQALEDVDKSAAGMDRADLWAMPGGAASVGFHLRHMRGSLDRLFTYARGEPLSDEQQARLASEKEAAPHVGAGQLIRELRAMIEQALTQLRATRARELDEPRAVGRAALPSTVRGLLFHAGEHVARHAGQVSTTAKVLQGLRGDSASTRIHNSTA
jgi:uncharacterized damage-inducible protein DinB